MAMYISWFKGSFYLAALLCICLVVFVGEYADAGEKERAFGGVFLLTTAKGLNYDPHYLRVKDSSLSTAYSAFAMDSVGVGQQLRVFDGMGVEAELVLQVGGSVFFGGHLGWKYKGDYSGNSVSSKDNPDMPYAYNELLYGALDIGFRGGDDSPSGFSWTLSTGIGLGANSLSGRYPASASKQVPKADKTAVDYTWVGGKTSMYFSETDFSFYFWHLKIGGEFFRSKSTGARLVIEYKLMYSDTVDVKSEFASGLDASFPTGPTMCQDGAAACPATSGPTLIATDAVYPLRPEGRFYILDFAYREHLIGLGVRWPLGGKQPY